MMVGTCIIKNLFDIQVVLFMESAFYIAKPHIRFAQIIQLPHCDLAHHVKYIVQISNHSTTISIYMHLYNNGKCICLRAHDINLMSSGMVSFVLFAPTIGSPANRLKIDFFILYYLSHFVCVYRIKSPELSPAAPLYILMVHIQTNEWFKNCYIMHDGQWMYIWIKSSIINGAVRRCVFKQSRNTSIG